MWWLWRGFWELRLSEEDFKGGVRSEELGGLRQEVVQGYMNAVRVTSIVLLIAICGGTLLLSQLDNATTGKTYGSVSQMVHPIGRGTPFLLQWS